MKITRRSLLQSVPGAAPLAAQAGIDRSALVDRHAPVLRAFDARSPLSLGNGEFAFTADATGLQTFPELYENTMPLCTQSQWGWHSFPGRPDGELRLEPFDTWGRPVGYASKQDGQRELFNWLRENPHRLHLGRIGLTLGRAGDVTAIDQTLDLWTGCLRSHFRVNDVPVAVETCCHPAIDAIAVTVRTRLLEAGDFGVAFEFPYGSGGMNAADWKHPARHTTTSATQEADRAILTRKLDDDAYSVNIGWATPAAFAATGPHRFTLLGAKGAQELSFVCFFGLKPYDHKLPEPRHVFSAAAAHWYGFWTTGAAMAFDGPKGARELERRVVLSQYLTAIQCSGTVPPQETGLTCNSWSGKFHLEMHWWHAAHFALWGRTRLLERSLDWYSRILPVARKKAQVQGYAGARWPKMVGIDGRDSPSPIGELLIWQQPHPIAYAELCWRTHRDKATLERYRDVVFATADFMASYAHWDEKTARYVLGPPVIPAQENHPPRETWNPTFEIEQWHFGLGLALQWRERLGLPPEPKWQEVRAKLSRLPVKEGVYLAHENCPQTYTERNRDHPSMLGALGVLPGAMVDTETMRRTLEKVFTMWKWADTWGWDFPMVAMTAARLGERKLAVQALLMETPKNTWLPNGHNWQRPNLPLYLPGNGGLLAAVAVMAQHSAFPPDWKVRHEGLNAFL